MNKELPSPTDGRPMVLSVNTVIGEIIDDIEYDAEYARKQ